MNMIGNLLLDMHEIILVNDLRYNYCKLSQPHVMHTNLETLYFISIDNFTESDSESLIVFKM